MSETGCRVTWDDFSGSLEGNIMTEGNIMSREGNIIQCTRYNDCQCVIVDFMSETGSQVSWENFSDNSEGNIDIHEYL